MSEPTIGQTCIGFRRRPVIVDFAERRHCTAKVTLLEKSFSNGNPAIEGVPSNRLDRTCATKPDSRRTESVLIFCGK